ncbi:MAG: CHASE2 domain-containing protein, partial [Cyanobacteria bacterium P01_F01_bin.53]
TAPDKIPPEIQQIQYIESIDLTDNLAEEDYTADEDKLLETLKRDAPYHWEHKELLVKALKWARQEDNPSILLRHHSLRHYTAWLKLAQQRKAHGPTQLQKDFVEASTQQPPDVTVDVFIASSSADIDFARKLNETLQIQGQSTWFEQESLLTAADSSQEITNSIAASENFVFLLSPDSAASEECMGMLNDAVAANKRILVILYAATHGVQPSEVIKEPIVFDFRQQDEDFLSNFGKLYRALESNPEHIREHTRLSMRANEWEQEDYDDSFLLRGKTLASAETWLKDTENNTPPPTDLQRRYIRASREQPLRRVSPLAVGLWGAAATLVVGVANILGMFQPVELAAYGHLLRQRSAEEVDDRFLIVKVDRTSGFYLRGKLITGDYEPGISSIPDQALLEGLQVLEAHEPRLIGLDFYRDFPANNPELAERLRSTENIIGICKATAGEAILQQEAGELSNTDLGGYKPIAEVAISDYPNRIGFNDLLDDGHVLVRRHYLYKELDPSVCQVRSAFSLLLAQHYLED